MGSIMMDDLYWDFGTHEKDLGEGADALDFGLVWMRIVPREIDEEVVRLHNNNFADDGKR